MNIQPVVITNIAREEVKKILVKKKISSEFALRIDVKGTGASCGNTEFTIGFDSKKDTDLEYSNNGIKILVDKKKVLYLIGQKLDYHIEKDAQGFFFEKVNENSGD